MYLFERKIFATHATLIQLICLGFSKLLEVIRKMVSDPTEKSPQNTVACYVFQKWPQLCFQSDTFFQNLVRLFRCRISLLLSYTKVGLCDYLCEQNVPSVGTCSLSVPLPCPLPILGYIPLNSNHYVMREPQACEEEDHGI